MGSCVCQRAAGCVLGWWWREGVRTQGVKDAAEPPGSCSRCQGRASAVSSHDMRDDCCTTLTVWAEHVEQRTLTNRHVLTLLLLLAVASPPSLYCCSTGRLPSSRVPKKAPYAHTASGESSQRQLGCCCWGPPGGCCCSCCCCDTSATQQDVKITLPVSHTIH